MSSCSHATEASPCSLDPRAYPTLPCRETLSSVGTTLPLFVNWLFLPFLFSFSI